MRILGDIKNDEKIDIPTTFDVCRWIRNNIQSYKIAEVKEFLVYFENYFDINQTKMIEHVYRGIKNSLKVEYAYEETESFVRWLIYLLSSDKKEFNSKSAIEQDLVKLVGEGSFLVNFFRQTIDAKDKIERKGSYLLFDKSTLTFLGGNVMFYYILISVVELIDRTINNPRYDLSKTLDWQEAIAVYVLTEFSPSKLKIKNEIEEK